jgi:putative RecB family exonuclease
MITGSQQPLVNPHQKTRDYLSFSAINTYRSCPLRYYFRYIERLPEETVSSALVFGSAIHAAIEFWFCERLAGNPEPDLDTLLSAYQQEWKNRDLDCITFGKNDTVDSLGQLAQKVLVKFTGSDFARPSGTVLAVEEELRDTVIDGCPDLLSRLDLVVETDDAIVVTDFKTSRSRWSQSQVEQSGEQLLLYAELAKDLVPGKPLRLEFVVVTKTKEPSIDRFTIPADQASIDRTRKMVERVWKGIESGLFYPAPSPMNCNSCPFWDQCREWCR